MYNFRFSCGTSLLDCLALQIMLTMPLMLEWQSLPLRLVQNSLTIDILYRTWIICPREEYTTSLAPRNTCLSLLYSVITLSFLLIVLTTTINKKDHAQNVKRCWISIISTIGKEEQFMFYIFGMFITSLQNEFWSAISLDFQTY